MVDGAGRPEPGTIKTFSFKIVIIMRRFYLLEQTNYLEHFIQQFKLNFILKKNRIMSCPRHYKPQSNFKNYCWLCTMLMLFRGSVCGFHQPFLNTHSKMRKQIHNNHQIQIKDFQFSTLHKPLHCMTSFPPYKPVNTVLSMSWVHWICRVSSLLGHFYTIYAAGTLWEMIFWLWF